MRRCWACWDNAPQSGQVQETGKGAPSRSLFRRGQTIPKDAYPARSAHRVWNRFRQGRERHGGTARWAADRHRLVPASGGGKAAAEYPGCAAQGPAGKTGNSDSGRAAASDPAGGLRQHLCAAGGGEAPAAGTHGPGECQAHRNAGTEHRCAGRVLRCGAGRERRSGCGRGPSGYVSGGVRPSGGFRRGGVSPGRGRGGVSPASCGHRAPAGLPDRDHPRRQRPRRQQRPIRQRRLRKPHPRARRRRLPWPTSSTPTRTCRTTCAWNRPCWALITAPR